MELNRKRRHICVINALAGVVVSVNKAYLAVFGHAVRYNRVAVVLRGDVNPACLDFLCGLVCSAVTVVELLGFCSLRKRQKLVTETDSEHRDLIVAELFELSDDLGVFARVSGAV